MNEFMHAKGNVDNLITVRDVIEWGVAEFEKSDLFYGHGTDNALDEAVALCLFALEQTHDVTSSYFDTALTEQEKRKVISLFRRRIKERKPAPYLTHEAWFAGLPFYVDERVLIPRSPIAELIENCFEPWVNAQKVHRILDLCTGSACIAIACAYAFPDALVDAADLSDEALKVAKINVKKHTLEDRVRLFKSDLFKHIPDRSYDLIVSNPPYVSQEEVDGLPEEYAHEPAMGLLSGDNGLEAVNSILHESKDYLSEDGVLVVEVGYSADALVRRYPQVPFMWLEFERGGEGVFILTAGQLEEYHYLFS